MPRKVPMKWDDGKPKADGEHSGTIYGEPFDIVIRTNRIHSQLTSWKMTIGFNGKEYEAFGASGGIQRALSCLREDLESLCGSL